MKTCPVCQAKAFDDALVCFGCLHRYDELDPEPGIDDEMAVAVDADPTRPQGEVVVPVAIAAETAQHASLLGGPPSFQIKMTPVQEASGVVTWKCAVELAS